MQKPAAPCSTVAPYRSIATSKHACQHSQQNHAATPPSANTKLLRGTLNQQPRSTKKTPKAHTTTLTATLQRLLQQKTHQHPIGRNNLTHHLQPRLSTGPFTHYELQEQLRFFRFTKAAEPKVTAVAQLPGPGVARPRLHVFDVGAPLKRKEWCLIVSVS